MSYVYLTLDIYSVFPTNHIAIVQAYAMNTAYWTSYMFDRDRAIFVLNVVITASILMVPENKNGENKRERENKYQNGMVLALAKR